METHDCPSCHGNIETSSAKQLQDAMQASRSDQRRESVIAGLAKPRLRRSLTLTRREHIEPVDSSTPCPPEDVVSAYCGGDRRSSSSSEFDTDLEEEAAEGVPVNTGRRTYALVCRKLGVNPISAIQRTLSEREIRVRRRGLSACDVLALACALQGNSNVRALDLEDNQLGSKGAKHLASLLWDNTYIRSLGLGYNDLGHDGAIALGEMLLENSSLTHINVSGNNIKDIDAILFGEVLQKNRTLQSINLSNNHIGDEGAKALGRALAMNEILTALDLSWNKIRPSGGVAICTGIKNNLAIKILNLAYNGLSSRGTKAMALALKFNRSLTDLDLTCNRIVDADVSDLAKALSKSNTSLRYLRMANNPLTTVSIRAMLEVLLRNQLSALQLIDMSTVHICTYALKTIQEVKSLRPSFRLMYAGIIQSDDQRHLGSDTAFSHMNPLTLMQRYIRSNNLRLVDLFKQFDKNGTGTVSREEFVGGLRAINLPLTQQQLDTLLSRLDTDGDGEVDYGELVTADKENRRKLRHRRERDEKDRKERRQKRLEQQQ